MKKTILSVVSVVALVAGALILRAQDPVKVDAKHYKVEFENSEVRVLRVNYGPGEKSVMHDHPEHVAVFLTDQKGVFATPDGKSTQVNAKAGEVKHLPAGSHLPQNTGDKPMEVIVVEERCPNSFAILLALWRWERGPGSVPACRGRRGLADDSAPRNTS